MDANASVGPILWIATIVGVVSLILSLATISYVLMSPGSRMFTRGTHARAAVLLVGALAWTPIPIIGAIVGLEVTPFLSWIFYISTLVAGPMSATYNLRCLHEIDRKRQAR